MIRLQEILYEGRKEDFEKKYANLISSEDRDSILRNDPSDNFKFVDWMGRTLSSDSDANVRDVIRSVNDFYKYQVQLGDINKYKTLQQLKHALDSRQKSNREKLREGGIILIDNDDFLVVAPTTHDSCGYYGNHTRWCITGSESWWNDYYYSNSIVIVEDKRHNEKYACIGRDGHIDVYSEDDTRLDLSSFVRSYEEDDDDSKRWPDYVLEKIEEYVSSDNVESRQQQHYDDKVQEYFSDYGDDGVIEDYLSNIHREYKIPDKENLVLFKQICANYGITEETLKEYSQDFLYNNIYDSGIENLDRMIGSDQFEKAIKDRGNVKIHADKAIDLEYAAGDYIREMQGITESIELLRYHLNPETYNNLFNRMDVETAIADSISKWNQRRNQSAQTILPLHVQGTVPKESFKIRELNDIVSILKHGGYDYMASLIQNNTIREGRIKLKDLISEGEFGELTDFQKKTEDFRKELEKEYPQIQQLDFTATQWGVIHIQSLVVLKNERHQGVGRKILERIKQFAEDNGATITLHPSPERGYKKKLDAFYKDSGFVNNKGRNRDYKLSSMFGRTMYYKPKKKLS
jgi:GNAT superfamily N-acetyltransferase